VRVDHFPSALAMLRTGIGVALLPEFMAKEVAGLVALSAPIDELQTPLWILTHPDLRNTARVRAFMQMIGDAMQKLL
jgi:DNA-binding transcriptional LysR family regulator